MMIGMVNTPVAEESGVLASEPGIGEYVCMAALGMKTLIMCHDSELLVRMTRHTIVITPEIARLTRHELRERSRSEFCYCQLQFLSIHVLLPTLEYPVIHREKNTCSERHRESRQGSPPASSPENYRVVSRITWDFLSNAGPPRGSEYFAGFKVIRRCPSLSCPEYGRV